jgi:hypothetical protein
MENTSDHFLVKLGQVEAQGAKEGQGTRSSKQLVII